MKAKITTTGPHLLRFVLIYLGIAEKLEEGPYSLLDPLLGCFSRGLLLEGQRKQGHQEGEGGVDQKYLRPCQVHEEGAGEVGAYDPTRSFEAEEDGDVVRRVLVGALFDHQRLYFPRNLYPQLHCKRIRRWKWW